ncbi:MAG: hypothetical protein JSV68_03355 [Anaerolineaceae bacterium]|nr:MAG: hypothetical protein JSV68_03355 [Anaerolineaceae bacterium]
MTEAYEARKEALAVGKASGDTHLLMIVNLRLAEILRQQGKLQGVIDICERQLKIADESGISESAVVGWLFGIWGEILAELNHLERAISLVKRGTELTARGQDVTYIAFSNVCLVRVLFSEGDLAGAEKVIQSLEHAIGNYDSRYSNSLFKD